MPLEAMSSLVEKVLLATGAIESDEAVRKGKLMLINGLTSLAFRKTERKEAMTSDKKCFVFI